MLKTLRLAAVLLGFVITVPVYAGNCDYSWQYDSAGRRCGGRAANVRPGGHLGGNGIYTDSYGRQRKYGPNNDLYDRYDYKFKYPKSFK